MKKEYFYNSEIEFYNLDDLKEIGNINDQAINIIIGFNDLLKLDAVPAINYLILQSGSFEQHDLCHLYRHREIKGLYLDYYETEKISEYTIDIAEFPELEVLVSKSSWNYIRAEQCRSLRALQVTKWYQGNLSCLQGMELTSLSITGGRLRSLTGIEKLPIRFLSIDYCSVTDVSVLNSLPKLQIVEIDHCPKIKDYSVLASAAIEYLLLLGNGCVANLEFLDHMHDLKGVVIELNILDGDISRLKKYMHSEIFQDRRHYSAKNKDLPKADKPIIKIHCPDKWCPFKGRNFVY